MAIYLGNDGELQLLMKIILGEDLDYDMVLPPLPPMNEDRRSQSRSCNVTTPREKECCQPRQSTSNKLDTSPHMVQGSLIVDWGEHSNSFDSNDDRHVAQDHEEGKIPTLWQCAVALSKRLKNERANARDRSQVRFCDGCNLNKCAD